MVNFEKLHFKIREKFLLINLNRMICRNETGFKVVFLFYFPKFLAHFFSFSWQLSFRENAHTQKFTATTKTTKRPSPFKVDFSSSNLYFLKLFLSIFEKLL